MDKRVTRPPIAMRHEAMRIAGRKVDTADRVPVEYPYTGEVIGTVPAGTAEHVREAFSIAKGYTPTLTRYERQQILLNVARIIRDRTAELKTFGTGAQILRALNVQRMRVLSAPKHMHAISGFGLEVVEYVSSEGFVDEGDAD